MKGHSRGMNTRLWPALHTAHTHMHTYTHRCRVGQDCKCAVTHTNSLAATSETAIRQHKRTHTHTRACGCAHTHTHTHTSDLGSHVLMLQLIYINTHIHTQVKICIGGLLKAHLTQGGAGKRQRTARCRSLGQRARRCQKHTCRQVNEKMELLIKVHGNCNRYWCLCLATAIDTGA
jgi:hypothetical protein